MFESLRALLARLGSRGTHQEPAPVKPNQASTAPRSEFGETADSADPEVEADDALVPRTAQEAAERLLALLAVIGRAHEPEDAIPWCERHGIDRFLTSRERAFILNPEPPQNEVVAYSWQAEAAVPIVWALQGIADMPPLNEQYDLMAVPMVVDALSHPKEFLSRTELRPAGAVEGMEQFLYHQHWRVRDAQLFGKQMPPELDPEIVFERRYALSWLAGWGSSWDDVPTDT